MRLAKASVRLLAVVAMIFCLLPVARAQNAAPQPAPKAKPKGRAKSKAPAANPAASAVAPASAPDATEAKPDAIAGKRDPFLPLVTVKKEGSIDHLPPGKAGLVIATVRVDGTVRSPNGMLAVVSNPEQRVYFVREGDRLYDGNVEKIGLDGVTFRENSKDAFGKAVERSVTKRIYPSAGEQQ
jgi:Tfp pilus assembly protein PilP